MSRPTIVFLRHSQIGSRHFEFGQELPDGLLPPEVVGVWIDQKWIVEVDSAERRSLYRTFYRFSGSKEREPLTKEINEFCLSE
jgi:hypothetical protein